MASKYSKGKWFACCLDAKPHFVFAGEGEKTICSMFHNDPIDPNYNQLEDILTIEECRANAKLIQAAPDLFENHDFNMRLCDDVLFYYSEGDINKMMRLVSEIKSNCITAIKKVTDEIPDDK